MSEVENDPRSKVAEIAPELGFFDAMAWPVPRCFAGAIAAMRFEEGDVLYRDRRAYGALEGKLPKGLRAIQVLLPKRSGRATSLDSEGDRRRTNWQSEVTIELIDLVEGRSETRVLSQGKLAMALFRGDDSWLDPEREEPALPWSARDLQQRLDQSSASFDARQKAKSGSRFIFVVDLASDTSRMKAAGVEDALAEMSRVERIDLSPTEAGIEEPDRFHPSLVVRALVLGKRTSEEILPTLRKCLYGGATKEDANREEGDAGSDRFSIGRHGILQDKGD